MHSLTQQGCLDRQRRLWSNLPTPVQWALVCRPQHVAYLSGFHTNPHSFSAGFSPWLLLMRPRESILIGDATTVNAAEGDYFASDTQIIDWYDGRNSPKNRSRSNLEALRELSKRIKERPGAIEGDAFPLSGMQLLSLPDLFKRDLSDTIRKMRRKKEPDEIELLKACAKAGEAGHEAAFKAAQPGATDLEVFQAVQAAAQQAAGRPCVVYGDFRSSKPDDPKGGGGPDNETLEAGDLMIVDYSVVINGYRLDFTNTIAVGGSPTPDQIGAMVACKMALETGEKLLRPGTSCKDVFAKMSDILRIADFDPLSHHGGHGIGLEHPELPYIASESRDTLEAGNVVTLEPGVYKKGIGGLRIERNYLITDEGFETLSQHRIDLV